MTFLGCSPCCSCSACIDKPKRLRISIQTPEASGQMMPGEGGYTIQALVAGAGEEPIEGVAVSTSCQPPGGIAALFSVRTISEGGGYTEPPVVSMDGNAVVRAVVRSPVTGITVTNGGSGYNFTPSVSFSSVGRIRAAAATAVVRGAVSSVTLTSGGNRVHDSPPTVSFGGGGTGATATTQIGNGAVVGLQITNGGSGYTSNPTITIEGNATAIPIMFQGRVFGAIMTSQGSGYAFGASPAVTITGGGGSGATATATVKYRVTGITLTSGGSGYPPSPPVTISGGGFATAAINGSVVAIRMTDGGLYSNSRSSSAGATASGWPTITISGSGGAQATPSFSGGVRCELVSPGEYVTAPSISFSGGGGSGAAAAAYLSYYEDGEVVADIEQAGCSVFLIPNAAYFPDDCQEGEELLPCSDAGGVRPWGELTSWLVLANISGVGGQAEILGVPGTPVARQAYFFPEEAVWVYLRRDWEALGWGFIFGNNGCDERVYSKRFFSRVAPNGLLTPRVADGYAYPGVGGRAAALRPVVSQHQDVKGDPIWEIKSFEVTDAGDNLVIGAVGPTVIPLNTNLSVLSGNIALRNAGGVPVLLTVAFSEPQMTATVSSASFTVAPAISFTFEAHSSGFFGSYQLASAAASGGTTTAPNGQYSLLLSITRGNLATLGDSLPAVKVTIAGGTVTGATISAAGRVTGAGSVVSAAFEPLNFFPFERGIIGRSGFQVVRSYTQPTVTASAQTNETLAVLAVTLAEDEDENGRPYWSVASVAVVSGGSGYSNGSIVTFSTAGTTIMPAAAVINLPPPEEPSLTASVSPGTGASFSVSVSQVEATTDRWEVSGVSVSGATSGYVDGTSVVFGGDDLIEVSPASAVIVTAREEPTVTVAPSEYALGTGAALTLSLSPADDFGRSAWAVSSITISDGGSGYSEYDEITASTSDSVSPYSWFYAYVSSVDGGGAITGIAIIGGGLFYRSTDEIESVDILSAGEYYKQRTAADSVTVSKAGRYVGLSLTETIDPIEPVECLGAVNGEQGWETAVIERDFDPLFPAEGPPPAVGETFAATVQVGGAGPSSMLRFERTRICPFSDFAFTFE